MSKLLLSSPTSSAFDENQSFPSHQHGPVNSHLSHISGPNHPELLNVKLGDLIDRQVEQYGDHTAAVFPWQQTRLSYRQLAQTSRLLAKAFLDSGLKYGDHIGIIAGNRHEYIEAFIGAARIGCPYVVFNNTYTPQELRNGLAISGTWMLPAISNKCTKFSGRVQVIINCSQN